MTDGIFVTKSYITVAVKYSNFYNAFLREMISNDTFTLRIRNTLHFMNPFATKRLREIGNYPLFSQNSTVTHKHFPSNQIAIFL